MFVQRCLTPRLLPHGISLGVYRMVFMLVLLSFLASVSPVYAWKKPWFTKHETSNIQVTALQDAQKGASASWSPLGMAGELNTWQALTLTPQWPSQTWWHALQDETLNQLLKEALSQHPTLAQLQAQLEQAQAQVKVVNALRLPQVSLGASYLWQQYGLNQFVFPLQGRTFHSFQIPLSVSYELDLWGKNRLQRDASKQEMLATSYDLDNARLQLASAVATGYLQYRKLVYLHGVQRRLENLTQQSYQHLLNQKAQGLLADEETLRQAHSQWLQAQAETLTYQQALSLTHHQLAYLTGHDATSWKLPQSMEDVSMAWFVSRVVHVAQSPLQVGVPAELALHRPDIQAQEAQLQASGIRVQVARKMFLPSLQIGGSTGLNAVGIRNLFKTTSLNSFLAPSVSQPLFTGGVLTGNLTIAKKQYEALFQRYKDTVLQAYVEVENSLTDLQAHHQILTLVQARYADAQHLESQAQRKVKTGLQASFQAIPSAMMTLEMEKASVVQATQCLTSWVGLQKALGGDAAPVSGYPPASRGVK